MISTLRESYLSLNLNLEIDSLTDTWAREVNEYFRENRLDWVNFGYRDSDAKPHITIARFPNDNTASSVLGILSEMETEIANFSIFGDVGPPYHSASKSNYVLTDVTLDADYKRLVSRVLDLLVERTSAKPSGQLHLTLAAGPSFPALQRMAKRIEHPTGKVIITALRLSGEGLHGRCLGTLARLQTHLQ